MSSAIAPNGNICLTFEDTITRQLNTFAARHFTGIADGYLIGPDSVPHITICQIHHDKPQPRAFRRDLGKILAAPEPIRLETIRLRPGTHAHADYTWVEFALTSTPEWLADLKFEVETLLRTYEITSLTGCGPDYHPHLTLCRFKTAGQTANAAPNAFTIQPEQMHLALGGADANGQVPKIFWQKTFT